MIDMPPLHFAEVNGIRMGYYEAGPKTDAPPVILCHGWPEIAFSWRHQIKALGEAGIRVRSMRTKSNRLEELFVRLTGDEAAAKREQAA